MASNIKYLGVDLRTITQDLCKKTFKILLGKIKDDLSKWMDILYS